MRKLKFRAWDGERMLDDWQESRDWWLNESFSNTEYNIMQYTGLKDKNGQGTTELYEGDIIGKSSIVGNIYETDPRETELVIPSITSKDWHDTYKEAVARGFGYAE